MQALLNGLPMVAAIRPALGQCCTAAARISDLEDAV
jgi:hypothetical protein